MKITDLKCAVFGNNPVVRITTDEGIHGLGEVEASKHYLKPHIMFYKDLIVGEDPTNVERVMMRVRRLASFKPWGSAVSAIEMALWDIAGKAAGLPVYKLLGGKVRDQIFCYATGNDIDWYREVGFNAVKLACPYGPVDGLDGLARNEALVAHTRELVGDDCEIMLDCYMAFDVDYTVRLAERLRPYRLKWIEEYLIPEDLDGHVAVRERLPWQTLATGEHMYTPWPFLWMIKHGAVDILQPDMNWVGGLTACRKIAEAANTAGLTVILHGGAMSPYGTHLTIAMPNMPWGEYFVGTAPGVPLAEGHSYNGTFAPVDSYVYVSDEPGFGVDIPADQLTPFG